MATTRYYARTTATETGTDGALVRDLLTTAGATTLISENVNSESYLETQRFINIHASGEFAGGSNTWAGQISVNAISGNVDGRFRFQRRNSSGVVQSSSAYSAVFTTTGVKTLSTTWDPGTWSVGDQLCISIEIKRQSGSHGNVNITTDITTASYVDAQTAVSTSGTIATTEASDSANLDGGVEISGQTAGPGGSGYLELEAANNEYALTSDKAALDITGDLEIIACVEEANGFVPGIVEQTILAKRDSLSEFDQAYRFYMYNSAAGDYVPALGWGNGGGDEKADADITGVITGNHIWLRATLDVDNGASGSTVTFYYSNDAIDTAVGSVSWTQLGTAQTTAGVTSIPNTTSSVVLGLYDYDGTPSAEFDGKIYGVWLYDGIGGTLVANPDFRDDTQGWSSPPGTDDNSNSWSLNNGAAWVSGSSGSILEAADTANLDGTVTTGASTSGTIATTEASDTANLDGNVEISGTVASTEQEDTANLDGGVEISGSIASTEQSDTAAVVGDIPIDGSIASTEQEDTAALSGYPGTDGSIAATEQPDTASASGNVEISGTAAVTEQQDTATLVGDIPVSGSAAVTEQQDTASLVGDVPIDGSIAATELSDTANLDGTVTTGASTDGTIATTEATDAASLVGDIPIDGSISSTEASDVVAASGGVEISGTIAATEGGLVGDPTHDDVLGDVAELTGTVTSGASTNGTIAATEQPDTASASGNVEISGTIASTEATDSAALVGDIPIDGSIAATELSDTANLDGDVPIDGSIAATEASDTANLDGTVSDAISGSIAATEAEDTAALTGDVPIDGSIAATELSDAVAAAGGVEISGQIIVTELSDSLAAVGDVPISGSIGVTEASDTAALTEGTTIYRLRLPSYGDKFKPEKSSPKDYDLMRWYRLNNNYSVLITGGVATPYPGTISPNTRDIKAADAGSGMGGYAAFIGGRDYTVTAAEAAILVAAGYTVEESLVVS